MSSFHASLEKTPLSVMLAKRPAPAEGAGADLPASQRRKKKTQLSPPRRARNRAPAIRYIDTQERCIIIINCTKILTRMSCISHQAKRRKEEKNQSPRNMKACHSVNTALLQSISEIGTHNSTMKSSIKTLHEFTSHIPPKTPKGNISSSTN
jgi:hypothetical protein